MLMRRRAWFAGNGREISKRSSNVERVLNKKLVALPRKIVARK